MKIGETISKLREEKKMTQEELAHYFHVTRQTISNWEKEKSFPDLQTLVEISEISETSLDAMLKENFKIVHQIDKKVRHLKIFKIGTVILAAIVLICAGYIGIQSAKRTHVIQTFEAGLQVMGFEKKGNNYFLEDTDFTYEIYTFDRPDIWKWNQDMASREKFMIGKYTEKNPKLEGNVDVAIRKTKNHTTLHIANEDYKTDGSAPQVREYGLDKKGKIKYIEKMDKADYKIYEELQNEIRQAVKKMDKMDCSFLSFWILLLCIIVLSQFHFIAAIYHSFVFASCLCLVL